MDDRAPNHKSSVIASSSLSDGTAHLPPDYNQTMIKTTLYVVFFANLFLNIDMGILPAGSTIIKKELKLNNSQFGSLGSVVYFGQVLGAAMASGILAKCSPKYILLFCLLFNLGALLAFTVTDQFYILAISRSLTGMFQIFFGIFQPVWADVFGNDRQKSLWLSLLIITVPLGVVLGYGLCAAFQANIGWKWAIYIQAMLCCPSLLGLLFIPSKYFDIQLLAEK